MGILGLFVPSGRCADLAGDADDAFAAQRGGLLEQFLGQVRRVEDGLGAPFAVAHVDEDQPAEVAAGMDPAGQGDGLADVRRAQFVAMMRSFHVNAECGIQNEESGIQSGHACWLEIGRISKRFYSALILIVFAILRACLKNVGADVKRHILSSSATDFREV